MRITAEQIEAIAERAAPLLLALSEAEVSHPPALVEWSKKEILGHLIDSAANNHQRFVRAAQTPSLTFPAYDQTAWVQRQNYRSASWQPLVEFWRLYNEHLAFIIRQLPEPALHHTCAIGAEPPVTLARLVSDYLRHLTHHIYDLLPAYPHLTLVHFTTNYTQSVLDLIVPIQREEFGVPITAQDQPDLADIPHFYQYGKGNFWIALDQNNVVGTIGLLDIGNGQAALRKMFVRQEFRGTRGVAKLLLDVLLEWAQAQAIHEIYLGTTNRFLAAHRFYEKHGFVEIAKPALPPQFPIMDVDSRFYRFQVISAAAMA
jgi:N-acetylglutamate synthase-like GNAT family acetyltransferase